MSVSLTLKSAVHSVLGDKPSIKTLFQPLYAWVSVAILIGIALVRIYLTYPIFSQTYDEPAHIARGMEWLDKGTYTYFLEHPPLAPVMVAAGPYLYGARATGHPSRFGEGNAILHTDNAYFRNLTLARLGILPFFFLATLGVWLWAKRDFGPEVALISTALFTTLPPILAHSGIATTDMAFTTVFFLALFAFRLWLEKPSFYRSLLLGIAVGLSLLAKFSTLAFFPIGAGIVVLIYWFRDSQKVGFLGHPLRQWVLAAVTAAIAIFFVIWGGYRFSMGRVNFLPGFLSELQLPASEYILGIRTVMEHNSEGHLSFLLGEVSESGWWYYFPVVIAVKTPLAFLGLLVVGFVAIAKQVMSRRSEVHMLIPGLVSLGVLGFAMTSNINIGQRHILPIYSFFAMIAGYGAYYLWSAMQHKRIAQGILIVLLLWYLGSTVLAHPDYLAYFNELAGAHPEDIVVDSNLDWGQDIYRLSRTLKEKDIEPSWGCLHSSHGNRDLLTLGIPSIRKLPPAREKTGWIVMSMMCLKLGTLEPPYDQYAWLEDQEPVERVGKSINLYFIPKGK